MIGNLMGVKPPTDKAHLRWWDDVAALYPGATFTCHGCGRQDSGAYVQPQHPFFARKVDAVSFDTVTAPSGREVTLAWVPARVGALYGEPHQRMLAALCADCVGAANSKAAADRKAQLAALPRCEVPACARRGSVKVARIVLLCGRHYNRMRAAAIRSMAGAGGMALFLPPPEYSRDDILRMTS
jgi:hypothetical protein